MRGEGRRYLLKNLPEKREGMRAWVNIMLTVTSSACIALPFSTGKRAKSSPRGCHCGGAGTGPSRLQKLRCLVKMSMPTVRILRICIHLRGDLMDDMRKINIPPSVL